MLDGRSSYPILRNHSSTLTFEEKTSLVVNIINSPDRSLALEVLKNASSALPPELQVSLANSLNKKQSLEILKAHSQDYSDELIEFLEANNFTK